MARGYATVTRVWRAGDRIAIALPLDLRLEATPGDPDVVADVRGPMVLAADLGPVEAKWDKPDPALVGADLIGGFALRDAAKGVYATRGVVRPADVSFVPFYRQYR
ncbi:glycoside hydrolase family 127 protein, partial [Escherichia coli]|nr:glycoside hydrolase family 127 protein [Escherichia coli]